MFEAIRKWLHKVTAPKCKHLNFTLNGKPTASAVG